MAPKEPNGYRKVVISVSTALIVGAIFAVFALWQRAVSADDVSRQIRFESPYNQDRELIHHALDKDIPEIQEKLDRMGTEQIQQRVILERIDRRLNGDQ